MGGRDGARAGRASDGTVDALSAVRATIAGGGRGEGLEGGDSGRVKRVLHENNRRWGGGCLEGCKEAELAAGRRLVTGRTKIALCGVLG